MTYTAGKKNTALESSWVKRGDKTLVTVKIITITVANVSGTLIVCLAL